MARNFASLLFTRVIQNLQDRHGSRQQYARLAKTGTGPDRLGPRELDYITQRDSFYIASIGETGWPYIQHRGGPKGFLKAVDGGTLAFADFSGNKQFISAGNLSANNRVALMLLDYAAQMRLKILGTAQILEGDAAKDWIEKVREPQYKAIVERVFVIHVEAFDWNCPQHITRRFTEEQVREALVPVENRMLELEHENQRLRVELNRVAAKAPREISPSKM